MNLVLTVHEIGLILAVILGIILSFKRKKTLRIVHFIVAILTVVSVFIYLIMEGFSNIGYDIYGLLIFLVFASMKWIKKSLALHVGLLILAVTWLIAIHVV